MEAINTSSCLNWPSQGSKYKVSSHFQHFSVIKIYIYNPHDVTTMLVIDYSRPICYNVCFQSLCGQRGQCHSCPKWDSILFGLLPTSRWQPHSLPQKKSEKRN